MAERSFAREVQDLRLGAGEEFRGEGILAVTKALLQSGVGYVAGYQGAPISHLMDVLSDAQDILADLGVHFEASASEAAAAAMLAGLGDVPDPRRGDLEIDRRHQRRLRCAVQPRVRRRDRRRADHHRRGLRRRLLDHAGAHARLRHEDRRSGCSIRAPTCPASSRGGARFCALGGVQHAGDAGAAHPRLPRARPLRLPRTTSAPPSRWRDALESPRARHRPHRAAAGIVSCTNRRR